MAIRKAFCQLLVPARTHRLRKWEAGGLLRLFRPVSRARVVVLQFLLPDCDESSQVAPRHGRVRLSLDRTVADYHAEAWRVYMFCFQSEVYRFWLLPLAHRQQPNYLSE